VAKPLPILQPDYGPPPLDSYVHRKAPGAGGRQPLRNKGGNQAPGQLECTAEIAGLGQQQVVGTIKNGRAFIDATTESPSVSAKDAGCPNGNWDVIVGDVVFHDYSFTITQGDQTLFTAQAASAARVARTASRTHQPAPKAESSRDGGRPSGCPLCLLMGLARLDSPVSCTG
jgi:hypothetical protein